MLAGSAIDNVPTCGVAVLSFQMTSWAQIREGSAVLLDFDYPKKE